MSIAAEKVNRLENIRDHLNQGGTLTGQTNNAGVLTSKQCRQLAQGFVGCNVVRDVIDFLCPIIKESTDEIVPGIRYVDLHASWTGSATIHAGALVRPLEGEESFLRGHDPWRCINRWLAVEAVIRVVEEVEIAEGEGRRPSDIAISIANTDALDDALDTTSCRTRSSSVTEGFKTWWNAYASNLSAILAQLKLLLHDFRTIPENVVKRMIGRRIAHQIDLGPENQTAAASVDSADVSAIRGLTRLKNNQFHQCIASLNKAVEIPEFVRSGWVRTTVEALSKAKELRRRSTFTSDDLNKLRTLLDWVSGNVPEKESRGCLTTLRQVASDHPSHVEGSQLDQVTDGLNCLANMLRTRGRPVDWANYRPVEDLFCSPLMANFDFSAWRDKAPDYGIPLV